MVEIQENEIPFLPEDFLRASEERLRAGKTRRKRTRDKLRAGKFEELDKPERLRARVRRVLADPIAGREIREQQESRGLELPSPQEDLGGWLLERIMGGENFLGVSFFDLGRRAARCIVRIEIRLPDGRSGTGTGSLISPRLLMTNNHVLQDISWARGSRAVFDHEDDADGKPRPSICFQLEPDTFFFTDPKLDFALVAVAEQSLQPTGVRLSDYGFIPLDPQQGKIAIGECINIIQHPSGMQKQVVLQDNQLLDLTDDWLHYESDTMPGSSGAPLFNNRWEMVGLHHAGWPERDQAGNILTRDGRIWTQEMGEQAVHWIGNEGARVSRLVGKMKEARPGLSSEAQRLLDDVLSPPKRGAVVVPVGPGIPAESGPMPLAVPGRPDHQPGLQAAWNSQGLSGDVTITVPLQITVHLGAPAPGAVTVKAPESSPETRSPVPPGASG